MLKWEYEGNGTWAAESAVADDFGNFEWIIGVCNDGTFDVSESDAALTKRKECFPTLADAKAFCEAAELAAMNTDNMLTEKEPA
jgi:hypothetical protein